MISVAQLQELVDRYVEVGEKLNKKQTDELRAEHNELAVQIQQARTEHRSVDGVYDPATHAALEAGADPKDVFPAVFIAPVSIHTTVDVN